MSKKLNTQEFIDRSNKIHNIYDYSLVNYINNYTKIKIICKTHGEFEQNPQKHLNGSGCPKCSKTLKLNHEEFIKRSNKIHKNKFNYSMVNYINCEEKVIIICELHGKFEQIPKSHMKGIGCPKCSCKAKPTNNEFIIKANNKHNCLYDYSKINYKNNHTDIEIICSKHGSFKQTPQKHLFGRGCPECGGSMRLTNEKFIEKAKFIHDNLYDYSEVRYKNSDTDVIIKCKIHGVFSQKPHNHLQGNGCKLCGYLSKGELKIKNILEENKIKYIPQYGFCDLKYKNPLKFDFGILNQENDLKYLIEYNGIQHYQYINFLHRSENNFELYKIKDKLKIEYCEKNNIELIIIKYDQYEKIAEILNVKFTA